MEFLFFKKGGRNGTELGEGGAGKNLGVRGGKKLIQNPLYEKEPFNKENKGEEGEQKSSPNKQRELRWQGWALRPGPSYLHPSGQFIFCT